MRAVVEATFVSTASHTRPSPTGDGRGGQTVTYSTVNAALPCRVARSKAPEQVSLADRATARTEYTIYTAHNVTIKPQDRLVVDGMTLEIVEVVEKRSINYCVIATAIRLR